MARKMKDSGIPWVGKIPEDWEVTRLKYVASITSGREIESQCDRDDGSAIPVYGSGGVFKYTDRPMCSGESILFGRKGTIGKPIYATGQFWIVDTMYCASVRHNKIFAKYLYYALIVFDWDRYKTRTTIPSLVASDAFRESIPLPPLTEQKRIAEYLDKTVGRIDGLREKISREIERLGDYKKSMISEAVCRGLDKTAKMKDSGIPWVGKIPEGWDVKKIASLYNVRNQKVSEQDFPALSVSKLGVVPQLSHVAKSNDTDNRKLVRAGDFAINSRSDRRGACGIAKQDGSVSLINIVLKPLENMEPGYFDWLFHSSLFADEFYKWGKGIDADVWSTHWTMMKKIRVPYPPLAEQKRIAEYIDKQVSKIDALIEKRKAELERLEALKRSIICECVTGKREVAA